MVNALLLIDVQYDFLPPSGSLAVGGGLEILPTLYRLLEIGTWDLIVASQDHHPEAHISFASRHALPAFTTIDLPSHNSANSTYTQELWPDHCIQNTRGSEIEHGVKERVEAWEAKGKGKVVRKGEATEKDEYSAFQGSASRDGGKLGSLIDDAKVTSLFIAGIATDFCVRLSVLEALRDLLPNGVKVYVITDAVRAVDPLRGEAVLKELKEKGARLIKASEVEELLD